MPARRWEDFLTLALTEIREYGADSIQVMRRLRATLDALTDAVIPEYRGAVDEERAQLDATIAMRWDETPDQALAARADRQGIGAPQALEG